MPRLGLPPVASPVRQPQAGHSLCAKAAPVGAGHGVSRNQAFSHIDRILIIAEGVFIVNGSCLFRKSVVIPVFQ